MTIFMLQQLDLKLYKICSKNNMYLQENTKQKVNNNINEFHKYSFPGTSKSKIKSLEEDEKSTLSHLRYFQF